MKRSNAVAEAPQMGFGFEEDDDEPEGTCYDCGMPYEECECETEDEDDD